MLKLLYFVWFRAHRLFLASNRLKMGQGVSSWLKRRVLGGHLAVKRRPFEAGKSSPGVRQVGTRGTFVLYFTDRNAFRVVRVGFFGLTCGVAAFMSMCVS